MLADGRISIILLLILFFFYRGNRVQFLFISFLVFGCVIELRHFHHFIVDLKRIELFVVRAILGENRVAEEGGCSLVGLVLTNSPS